MKKKQKQKKTKKKKKQKQTTDPNLILCFRQDIYIYKYIYFFQMFIRYYSLAANTCRNRVIISQYGSNQCPYTLVSVPGIQYQPFGHQFKKKKKFLFS